MTIDEIETDVEEGKRQRHDLKCVPPYFDAVCRGDKTFEVRRDDRGFQKGDVLNLREYDRKHGVTEREHFTGNAEQVLVTYVLTGGQFGVEPGHVVMGIKRLAELEQD
jgi:hypothetical protein